MSIKGSNWLDFVTGADWPFNSPTTQSSVQIKGYNRGLLVSEMIELKNPEGENDSLPTEPLPLLVNYEFFLPMIKR